jgi:hypothetical protein
VTISYHMGGVCHGLHLRIVQYSLSAFGAYLNKRMECLEVKTEKSFFFQFFFIFCVKRKHNSNRRNLY